MRSFCWVTARRHDKQPQQHQSGPSQTQRASCDGPGAPIEHINVQHGRAREARRTPNVPGSAARARIVGCNGDGGGHWRASRLRGVRVLGGPRVEKGREPGRPCRGHRRALVVTAESVSRCYLPLDFRGESLKPWRRDAASQVHKSRSQRHPSSMGDVRPGVEPGRSTHVSRCIGPASRWRKLLSWSVSRATIP
jgi:hypothetical protein